MRRYPPSNQTESARNKQLTQTHYNSKTTTTGCWQRPEKQTNRRRNTTYTKSLTITTIYLLSLTTTPIVQRKAAFRKKTHLNHNEAKMSTRQEPKTHNASRMN